MAPTYAFDRVGHARPELLYQVRGQTKQSAFIVTDGWLYRSKPLWWTKYTDEQIRAKWMEEAKAQPIRGFMLETEHVQYVLDELATFDKARTEDGIQVRCGI